MNLLGILALLWPAAEYGWIAAKLTSVGPWKSNRWLPFIVVPSAVGSVYYLIYGCGWTWLVMYPVVLLVTVVLIFGFVVMPFVLIRDAWISRDEPLSKRTDTALYGLALAVGGLVVFWALRANDVGPFLLPWSHSGSDG